MRFTQGVIGKMQPSVVERSLTDTHLGLSVSAKGPHTPACLPRTEVAPATSLTDTQLGHSVSAKGPHILYCRCCTHPLACQWRTSSSAFAATWSEPLKYATPNGVIHPGRGVPAPAQLPTKRYSMTRCHSKHIESTCLNKQLLDRPRNNPQPNL